MGELPQSKWLSERVEILKHRYFVAKAKVDANYKPEYHQVQADTYKDALILLGVPEGEL